MMVLGRLGTRLDAFLATTAAPAAPTTAATATPMPIAAPTESPPPFSSGGGGVVAGNGTATGPGVELTDDGIGVVVGMIDEKGGVGLSSHMKHDALE